MKSRRVRIVAYAINGRGMGHLVRQLAILRMARRLCAFMDVRLEAWVLTSSEADTLARREGVPALKMPSKAMLRDSGLEPTRYLAVARGWVLNAITGLAPDLLVVDTFPGGSFGELLPVLDLVPRKALVARAVKAEIAADDSYAPLLELYDDVVVPESSGIGPILIRERAELVPRDEARRRLGIVGDRRAIYVSRGGGGDVDAARELPVLVKALRDRDAHVVVGAGPLYQGPEIRGEGITWLDRYTPCELLSGVDGAISAAGYNSFHELMQAGVPTLFIPQGRISDDQHARAQSAVDAGAAAMCSTVRPTTAVLEALDGLLGQPDAPERARSLVPGGGARAAAARLLCQVLPEADVRQAERALSDELVRLTAGLDASAGRKTWALVRMLAGPTPSASAERRATLLRLHDEGVLDALPKVPKAGDAAGRIERILGLCHDHEVAVDTAISLLSALHRTFPPATPDELVDACILLFPAWARFEDWMGAISLLRAVPTQRIFPVVHFAEQVVTWLEGHDDLFEAVAAFSRMEGRGARAVPEVLHLLNERAP